LPERLSIVGFDDIPEAPYLSPPLTTVRPDFAAVAEHAIQAILTWRDEGNVSQVAPLAPELVVRASVGPPRS
jgi:DNA-binding LacI/PurR family transcriptional regulator